MRDVKRKQQKNKGWKENLLAGATTTTTTTQDGNIKLIHFHFGPFFRGLIVFFHFCAARLSLPEEIFQCYSSITKQKITTKGRTFEKQWNTGWGWRRIAFFLLFIACTECVTILDGFPTIRTSMLLLCRLFSLKGEENRKNKRDFVHMCVHGDDEILRSRKSRQENTFRPLMVANFSN